MAGNDRPIVTTARITSLQLAALLVACPGSPSDTGVDDGGGTDADSSVDAGPASDSAVACDPAEPGDTPCGTGGTCAAGHTCTCAGFCRATGTTVSGPCSPSAPFNVSFTMPEVTSSSGQTVEFTGLVSSMSVLDASTRELVITDAAGDHAFQYQTGPYDIPVAVGDTVTLRYDACFECPASITRDSELVFLGTGENGWLSAADRLGIDIAKSSLCCAQDPMSFEGSCPSVPLGLRVTPPGAASTVIGSGESTDVPTAMGTYAIVAAKVLDLAACCVDQGDYPEYLMILISP